MNLLFNDIEMKQYIKPSISSYNVSTHKLIASSKPDIETVTGGFYECSNAGCKTDNPLTWDTSAYDSRDDGDDTDIVAGYVPIFNIPYYKKEWQYIGCYEYKSNGSGVLCEVFHGTEICEGTQWDLFINANGEYYVRSCPDKH